MLEQSVDYIFVQNDIMLAAQGVVSPEIDSAIPAHISCTPIKTVAICMEGVRMSPKRASPVQ
jgi:hypothetical protein